MLSKSIMYACLVVVFGIYSVRAAAVSANQKVGIAWPASNDISSLHNFKTANSLYLYSWSPSFPSNAKSLGFKPVPMLWGTQQIASFQSLVAQGYADAVLGFNEPDQVSGSNIPAVTAAALWRQYIEPLKSEGYRLISPAVSNSPSGKTWLKDFFTFCSGCTIDAVAVHYYGTSATSMTNYIADFHNSFGKPIWVTEFAYEDFNSGTAPDQVTVDNYMTQVIAFMEASSYIEVYFAFGLLVSGSGPTQLINSDGTPTALGVKYLNPA